MKRILSLLAVTLILIVALCACAPSDQGSSSGYSSDIDYSAAEQADQTGSRSNVSGDSKIIELICYQQGQVIVDATSATGIELNVVDIPGQTFDSYDVWEWKDDMGITHAFMYSETTPCALFFAN